jgi:ComF family protein
MPLSRAAHWLLGLLLPPSCMSCGAAIDDGAAGRIGLCPTCQDELAGLAARPACPRCAHGIGPYASCPLCVAEAPPFQAAVRVGPYAGPLAELIRIVKYHGVRVAMPLVADLLMARLEQSGAAEEVDLVTAVPLHWWRYYRRGYNQASLLMREMRRRGLRAPAARVLVRTRDTRPQVGLSRAARLENVRGAFRVRRAEAVRGRRVLLVDDVMTTGATAGACARELLKAGARGVTVAVAAVAEGLQQPMAAGRPLP